MSPPPKTRQQLVRALVEAPDDVRARRLARDAARLTDERCASLLLERFSPLPLDDRPRAESVVRAARAIAAVDGGDVCRAVALRLAGVLEHLDGHPAKARRQLMESARLLSGASRFLDAGDVYRILVDVQMRAEDYTGAREMAQRARRCYARQGRIDPRRLGSLEMNIGNLHHRRDEHSEALEAYSRARRHYRRAGETLHLGIVDYNRANVLILVDRTREARRLYEQARETFVKRKIPALIAQADFALAGIDLIEGRLDACIERLRNSRERLEALGDRLRLAHADLDAAEAFLRLNRPAEAERAAKLADGFFRRAGQIAESAMCAGVLGGAALQRGEARQASRLFARGRDLQRGLKNRVAAAMLEIGQAQAELHAGRPRVASRIARGAAAVLAQRKLGSRQARALAVGAEAALESGRLRAAKDLASRARALARRHRDVRVELAALMTLGRTAERRGEPDVAYRHLLAAERCVEKLRRGITSEESQLAFALDKSEVYEALILNRLNRGDRQSVRRALVFAERGKARALTERLAQGHIELFGSGSPRTKRLIEKLSDIEQKLALVESRLDDPASASGMRSARIADLESLTRLRMQTLERLARNDPERACLVGAKPPDPMGCLRSLASDEIVLEYTRAGDEFHLFAMEQGRVEAYRGVAPVGRVAELADLLRFHLSKGVLGEDHAARFGGYIETTIRTYLERLHDLLLRPVADRLEGKRVRIIPHGILHGLPFHAMESGGAALVDLCTVSYVPSLATLELLSRRSPASVAAPMVLGVADRAAPLIRREVDAVRRRLHGARVFRGRAATREVLRRSEDRPSLLHVACHGMYSEDGPWSSGLRLGDTWLSLPDLYAMKGMARLVVLSGCETGRGTVYSGDEWVGLVRGFLQAGAGAVVASLWEVHDRCTLSLMEDFYAGLANGLPVAHALTMAQRNARRREPLPLRWAPFVVIGEPELRIPLREVA